MSRTKRRGRAEPGSYRAWRETGWLGLSTSEESATRWCFRTKQSIKIQQQPRERHSKPTFKNTI